MKYCPKCELELEEDNFSRNKARYDGYDSYCKKCRRNNYKEKKQKEYKSNELNYDNKSWKKISNFNKYEASTDGYIRNAKTKRLIKGTLHNGYLVSSLSNNNNILKNIKFHRIIAETFIDNPENKHTVNHKDKNRQNNSILNLEWSTNTEQVSHKYTTNPLPKISISVKKIIMYNNNFSTIFNSVKDGCKFIKENNLCNKEERYIHNKIYKSIHTNILAFNYYWKYMNNIIDSEIWKKWNNISISNLGRTKDKFGYIRTHTCKNKNTYITIHFNKKNYRLHRIIAETFIDNQENKPIVNHIDGNKQNNKVSNLEWVTSSENQLHAYKVGLHPIKKKIKQIDINTNNIIKIWNNMNEIYNEVGFFKSGISCCLSGRYKTSHGFKWEYL